MTKKGLTDTARFLTHVDPERVADACWPWIGCRYATGYGAFQLGQRPSGRQRHTGAHRAAYELFVGPIPAGMHVLHRCDTRACVNPSHLFIGTNAENVLDREQKGRGNHVGPYKSAKLTPEQVEEIRMWYARGGVSKTYLAKVYGVTSMMIHHIVTRHSWRHVP